MFLKRMLLNVFQEVIERLVRSEMRIDSLEKRNEDILELLYDVCKQYEELSMTMSKLDEAKYKDLLESGELQEPNSFMDEVRKIYNKEVGGE